MSFRELTPTEANELFTEGAVLLDVREENEFEAGHASSAVHIPLSELPDHLQELPKNTVIMCVCRSGQRSMRAAKFLESNEYDVVNVSGGMTQWQAEGFNVVSDAGVPEII